MVKKHRKNRAKREYSGDVNERHHQNKEYRRKKQELKERSYE